MKFKNPKHMENKFYNYLMTSPVVYYIYNRGSIIYGLETKDSDIDFLVVVDPEFQIPEEFSEYTYDCKRIRKIRSNVKYENCDFIFFTTDEWFTKVTNGDFVAWECACLPKKFIHKEHVKLLMSTNPLQLRKDFEEWMNLYYLVASQHFRKEEFHEWRKGLWEIIKRVKLTNQIIENHKIINYKAANSEYMILVANNIADEAILLKM